MPPSELRAADGAAAAVTNEDTAQLALAGLLREQKSLPAKLFYDDEGCRLFGEITRLPEYYVTRIERGLLTGVAREVAETAAPGAALVEYGASDEAKALTLIDALPGRFGAYVPIDIAAGALETLAARLAVSHPLLEVHPLAADFLAPFALPAALADRPRLGFFPGSTIGNLDPAAARRFLAAARLTLGAGARFLVGADLRKDPALLLPAYDDAAGVTAAFNLNMLVRLNREAAAGFEMGGFTHEARWNDGESRIEMHLVSRRAQTVPVAGRQVRFRAGETIHTENSYKYTLEALESLAGDAGWRRLQLWTDPARLFSIQLLEARQ